jgi:hypothetical protein
MEAALTNRSCCFAILCVLVVAAAACGPTGPGNSGDDDDTSGDDDTTAAPDAAPPGVPDAALESTPDAHVPVGGGAAPGSSCSCDADCADEGSNNPGACIYGICMTMASAPCASGGSQGECPAGSRCWGLTGFDGGSLCWPDCDAHACSGTCDGDGSCAPGSGDDCDPTCGAACSCTATSCGADLECVGGECVPPQAGGPGPGPGPTCTGLPVRDCTGTNCGQLIAHDPRTTAAWDDYPINGETAGNQYRSYDRRDLVMLVEYATSKTLCKTMAWTDGNGGPLGLGDMSEANGAIPGTSIGEPGHPAGTHTNGFDIDLGYYQSGTTDNRLRPICDHMSGNVDQYHCVTAPTSLDVWRHALFLGYIFESSRVRVIGVDGKAGPLLMSALDQLCDTGWLDAFACSNITLAYEETDEGLGWFYFHHHHSHISLEPVSFTVPAGARVKAGPRGPALHRL